MYGSGGCSMCSSVAIAKDDVQIKVSTKGKVWERRSRMKLSFVGAVAFDPGECGNKKLE